MSGTQWNSRYLCYCYAQGVSDPEEMIRRDTERFPGGKMLEFIAWSNEQRAAFFYEHPAHGFHGSLSNQAAHDAYDVWLQDRFPKPTETTA